MTDLHTHILPAMDDGAGDLTESLALLAMERDQGVDTVCLTPHFYPDREPPEAFLRRRAAAFDALRAALPAGSPDLRLGAEVAWFPTIAAFDALEALRLEGSDCFLLELPYQPWTDRLLDSLCLLPERTGLTPVLAHVERYIPLQSRGHMAALLSMGLPMQMNADSLLGSSRRRLSLLKRGLWFLGSDCHSAAARPPRMGQAADLLRARLGPRAEPLLHCPFELL